MLSAGDYDDEQRWGIVLTKVIGHYTELRIACLHNLRLSIILQGKANHRLIPIIKLNAAITMDME